MQTPKLTSWLRLARISARMTATASSWPPSPEQWRRPEADMIILSEWSNDDYSVFLQVVYGGTNRSGEKDNNFFWSSFYYMIMMTLIMVIFMVKVVSIIDIMFWRIEKEFPCFRHFGTSHDTRRHGLSEHQEGSKMKILQDSIFMDAMKEFKLQIKKIGHQSF